MGAWTCQGCGFRTGSADDAAWSHRCGASGLWFRCTCGSGGHPRECELHPENYGKHIAELDAIGQETDEGAEANHAAEMAAFRVARRALLEVEIATCRRIAGEMEKRVSEG